MEGIFLLLLLAIPAMILFSFIISLKNSSRLKSAHEKIERLSQQIQSLETLSQASQDLDDALEKAPAQEEKTTLSLNTKTAENPPQEEQRAIIAKEQPKTEKKLPSEVLREQELTKPQEDQLANPVKAKPKEQPLPIQPPAKTKTVDANDPFEKIKTYLTQGNPMVKVAIVLLFFGCSFLMKYAQSRNLIPLWAKYSFISALGFALSTIGWKLREKRHSYALALQGGGIGLLYITLFSAFRLHHLLGGTATFTLLTILAGLSVCSAIYQNSRVLAGFGVAGAFLAPILSSTGGGSHITLFSFYMVINISIFLISLKKNWRELNIIGFSFSLIIALLWTQKALWTEHILSLEIFLVAFFLLYFSIPIIQAYKKQFDKLSLNLFFALPVIVTLIQVQLLKDFERGLAWHLLALTLIYAVNSRLCKHLFLKEQLRNIAIVSAYLSIPAFFSQSPTISLLALASAASLSIKELCKRPLERSCALISLASSLILLIPFIDKQSISHFLFNEVFMNCLIVSSSFFIAAIALKKNLTQSGFHTLAKAFTAISILVFYGNILYQIDEISSPFNSLLLYISSTIFVFISLKAADYFQIKKLKYILHGHLVLTLIATVVYSVRQSHIFDGFWAIGLASALALSLYKLLKKQRKNKADKASFLMATATIIIALSTSLQHFFRLSFPNAINFTDMASISVTLIFTASCIFYSPKILKDYRRALLIAFEIILASFLFITLAESPVKDSGRFLPL